MKVRGDFLGPPRSTGKTTLIIKVIKLQRSILRIGKIRALNESAGRLFRAATQHRQNNNQALYILVI